MTARPDRYLVASICILLGGCSLFQPAPAPLDQEHQYSWSALRPALTQLEDWSLSGKIGLRTPEHALSAAINQWQQHGEIFDIQLSSTFFGLGQSRLMGNPAFLMIEQSGEEPVSSDQPEALLEQALGLPLPVTALMHWIKGAPYPDTDFVPRFHASGLLHTLQQNDWILEFDHYGEQGSARLPLPGRIKLQRGEIRITLVIKEWILN
jgi:outer membrane lipoprotein LolB